MKSNIINTQLKVRNNSEFQMPTNTTKTKENWGKSSLHFYILFIGLFYNNSAITDLEGANQ